MRILSSNPNVDNSDLVNFPDGRIKDNDGSGNGTGINERTNGDIHQTISRLMRKYGIVPNGLPDNVTNGYQIVEAIQALASKNDFIICESVAKFHGLICDLTLQTFSLSTKPMDFKSIVV